MKKSSFTAMLLGTASGVLFALGMCMALLEEWNAFGPGIALGSAGLLLGVITWFVWRRMERKPPLRFSAKGLLAAGLALAGALTLGTGMCFCMVWGQIVAGILIGLLGIAALLSLVPLVRGIRS